MFGTPNWRFSASGTPNLCGVRDTELLDQISHRIKILMFLPPRVYFFTLGTQWVLSHATGISIRALILVDPGDSAEVYVRGIKSMPLDVRSRQV